MSDSKIIENNSKHLESNGDACGVHTLPLALDVMGSDRGPEVLIQGAIEAYDEFGIKAILVGSREIILQSLKDFKREDIDFEIEASTQVVEMKDSPAKALRQKQDSSILKSFKLVKNKQASGVISAGNTGAMMAAGMLTIGTLPGVARPAIATIIPKTGDATPTVLLDSGANVDCHALQLVQFALMGDFYAKAALGLDTPRIGLLSNGTEDSKGNDLLRSSALTINNFSNLNYIGYIEGRDLPKDIVDVVVCDGFVGNIVLKTMEGAVDLVLDSIKDVSRINLRAKLGMLLAKPVLRKLFKEKLDPSAYGGAPLLGLRELAIVCHGSSTSRAIKNALRVSDKLNKAGLMQNMALAFSDLDESAHQSLGSEVWSNLGNKLNKPITVNNKVETKN